MDGLAMTPLWDLARRDLLADAIPDRLVHNAHRFTLPGESIRKRRNGLIINGGMG
jgi:DNA replication protein DnaC